jgi:hypothetical protein
MFVGSVGLKRASEDIQEDYKLSDPKFLFPRLKSLL